VREVVPHTATSNSIKPGSKLINVAEERLDICTNAEGAQPAATVCVNAVEQVNAVTGLSEREGYLINGRPNFRASASA
jgi:hypothetical protein